MYCRLRRQKMRRHCSNVQQGGYDKVNTPCMLRQRYMSGFAFLFLFGERTERKTHLWQWIVNRTRPGYHVSKAKPKRAIYSWMKQAQRHHSE